MPGYTAECMSGQHPACVNHDCRCGCHAHVKAMLAKSLPAIHVPQDGNASLICPACTKPGKVGDQFCRQDGLRLTQGKLCGCGAGAEPTDLYCGACGQKFGSPAVALPELSEEDLLAIEKKARMRPSDVEMPPTEVH